MPADDSEVREALKGISTVPDVKPLPRWFRTANRAVSVMSRFGFTMGPVCVLTVPGRRTGKPRCGLRDPPCPADAVNLP